MLIVLNLKMNVSGKKIIEYEASIKEKEVIVLPQFPYLGFFRGGKYQLGSQDVSKYKSGAYTGEVCAKGLKSIGCKYALIGHPERKELFNETVMDVKKKMENAIEVGLTPIFCVSENYEQYLNDKDMHEIDRYLNAIPDNIKYIIVAYEPSFMIGKEIPLDYNHINLVLKRIKGHLLERGINGSVIYGGGVRKDNIDELYNIEGIDGVIISSAAINPIELDYIYNKLKEK